MRQNHDNRSDEGQIIKESRNRHTLYLLIVILLLGALLRLYKLGEKSLWYDEVITLEDALLPYSFWKKSHMLYFLMVRFFLHFGHSEFWLRLASALFGILGIPMIYLVGREIFDDKRVGLLSALVIALSLHHLRFSQEARYYPALFFFSALALYLFALFLKRKSLVSLFLLPLVCTVNYLIHPTGLVFSGILLAWVPFSLIATRQGRSILKEWRSFFGRLFSSPFQKQAKVGGKKDRKSFERKKVFTPLFSKILIIILLLALLSIGLWTSWKIGRLAFGKLKGVKWFKAPAQGVYATFDFFFKDHFIVYGPVIQPNNILGMYVVFLFILFFLVGYMRALIRRFAFCSFFIFSIAVSLVLIFSVPQIQSYDSKYIFYIYPGNVICLMYGFITILDFLKKNAAEKFRWNPLYVSVFLYAAFLIPQLYKDFNFLRGYYRGVGSNVKGLVRHIKENMGENDVIASYGLSNNATRYYVKYFGVPDEKYYELKYDKGAGLHTIQTLLKGAGRGGTVWYIYAWPDLRPMVEKWIEKHFDDILRYPTYPNNPKYDIVLWKWKFKDRFLSNEIPVKMSFSLDPVLPMDSPDHDSGWLKSEQDIYINHEITALLDYNGSPEDIPSSFTMVLFSGDREITRSWGTGRKMPAMKIDFKEGATPLKVYIKSADKSGSDHLTLPVVIKSEKSERRFFHAIAYDSSTPSLDIESLSLNGATCVFMPYNSFVGYNISIKENGFYNLAIKAGNDSPGPILYEVDIDDKPVGILSFYKADESWEIQEFPVKLTSGQHEICIYYISNVLVGSRAEKEDSDSWIQYLYLEKLSGEKDAKDQRVFIPGEILVPISRIKRLLNMSLQDADSPGWQPRGLSGASVVDVTPKDRTFKALQAEIPQDVKAAGFSSPAIPVKTGQIVYFSVKAGVENLKNHSANVMLVYMDKDHKVVGQNWINSQGIMEDVPEVKFICFRTVPSGIEYIAIHLTVYANSRKPFQSPGRVWYYDFRSDVELMNLNP
jgi:4-amino-4-deoxy-L-arabinose transferase-like glycosyltransferase